MHTRCVAVSMGHSIFVLDDTHVYKDVSWSGTTWPPKEHSAHARAKTTNHMFFDNAKMRRPVTDEFSCDYILELVGTCELDLPRTCTNTAVLLLQGRVRHVYIIVCYIRGGMRASSMVHKAQSSCRSCGVSFVPRGLPSKGDVDRKEYPGSCCALYLWSIR